MDDIQADELAPVLRNLVEARLLRNGDALSKVRGVVLSGEASSSAMHRMRDLLARAFPDLQDTFRFFIPPVFVPAAGATEKARRALVYERKIGMTVCDIPFSYPYN